MHAFQIYVPISRIILFRFIIDFFSKDYNNGCFVKGLICTIFDNVVLPSSHSLCLTMQGNNWFHK